MTSELEFFKKDMDAFKDSVDTRFEMVHKDISSLRQYVDVKFEGVDQRFDQVDRRFDEIDERIDKLDEKFVTKEEFHKEIGLVRKDISESKADTLKWMFIFWVGQVAASVGIIAFMLKK